MTLKTKVGQVLLIHTKDENYASLYEEAFTKQGQSVQLFAVIEITPRSRTNDFKNRKAEYETFAKTLVSAFKKVYVSSPVINEDTFERALTAINSALGKLGTKNKSNWFSDLHIVLCALVGKDLFLSTAGNALAYLHRGGNLTLLSEDLSAESKPVKVFANYAAGRILRGDRIVLSTSQLFNYVSFDKFRESLQEDSLDEACQEIISTLSDIKNIGFAAFIFETLSEAPKEPILAEKETSTSVFAIDIAEESVTVPRSKNNYSNFLQFILNGLETIAATIFAVLRFIFLLVLRIFKKNRSPAARKSLVAVTAVVLVLLIASIAFSIWRKSAGDRKDEQNSNLARAESILNGAEAALIYQDENRVLSLVSEAEGILANITISDLNEQVQTLKNQASEIKGKINKETVIENPTILATFSMSPTDLIRSSEGFLAHNRNTGEMAFYDFRNGETKEVLKTQNLSSLIIGGFVGGPYGIVFLNRNGKFSQSDVVGDKLTEYPAETLNLPDIEKANVKDFAVLGAGDTARIYVLDAIQNQIWRFRATTSSDEPASPTFGSAEKWLKSEAVLSEARDLAIDNGVYVLFGEKVERYFNGSAQNFSLSPVSPAFSNLQKIYTTPDQQYLYILDSQNERILIYNKSGKLQTQLKSSKFRDGSDLYVDEKNKIVYLLSGSELLQVNY